MIKKIIIIGGATATEKTQLAFKIAEKYPSVVINADSMQVYKDLKILSNRPSFSSFNGIENKLYGVLNLPDSADLGWWHNIARKEIKNAQNKNKIPIIVGGTGLYLNSIEKNVSFVPIIKSNVRDRVRRIYSLKGINFLYKKLVEVDFPISKKIHFNDKHRILRALEVKLSTGKSLTYWRRDDSLSISDDYLFVILKTDRETLYKNIDNRFKEMIKKGLIEEVREFMKKENCSEHPINKMIGLKHIKKFVLGDLSLDEAISFSQRDSRRYAKRQITWFNHQPQNAQHLTFSSAYNFLLKC